jgi:hypothetical protein
MIRIALLLALAALTLLPAGAHAQPNTQKCTPSIRTHTVIVRLPGVKVAEQTCVIRFNSRGTVKAWVHTKWKRTSFATRFRRYSVSARLELRDVVGTKLVCRYAREINRLRRGERTCETGEVVTQAFGWTSDGAVAYGGRRTRVRGLTGSPRV